MVLGQRCVGNWVNFASAATVQAVIQSGQMGHLAGDVPALFIVAAALAILTPRSKLAARPRTHNMV
ncbi:DUF6632 domain-containing protein [Pseudomonas sp. BIC9C]|uniref:DUF6632 domain-containing protein n=1 Tax=Pseudomonas sp. BIC9C TaxID=3078458 RepID=UPI002AD40FC2